MRLPTSWLRTSLIFLAFAALYLALGRRVAGPAAMLENVPFDADVYRVVGDLTRPEFGHYRTLAHPLFVLLLLPPGAFFADLMGAPYEGARCLTALAAAAAVALLDWILRRVVRGPRELSWLLTLLYGVSASTLVFGTIPETYMFGALSILPAYALLAAGVRRSPAWVGVIVSAFAVTSTNVVQALAGYRFALAGGMRAGAGGADARRAVRFRAALTLLAAGVVALALNLWQVIVFPSSAPLWARSEEGTYAHLGDAFAPRAWTRTARAVLVDAVVGRDVDVVDGHVVVRPGVALGAGGMIAAALWLGVLGVAAAGAARRRGVGPPLVPVLAIGLGFNTALHVVYGSRQVFLYSPHWTFLLVLILALGLPERPRAWLRGAVAAMTLAVALHNAWFFLRYLEALEQVAALRC